MVVVATDATGPADVRMPAFQLPVRAMREMHFEMAAPDRPKLASLFARVDVAHLQFPFWLSFAALGEARRAGVPVVASAIPALAEVCGPAALLVPPGDAASWAAALSTVLQDTAAASGMIEAGTALAAAATWETGGRALSGLLSSVANSTSWAAAAG